MREAHKDSCFPTILEVHETANHIAVVMERMDIVSLYKTKQILTIQEINAILIRFASTINQLSKKNVFLGALNPGNVLLVRNASILEIKIIGFRNSILPNNNSFSNYKDFIGYLAPELFRNGFSNMELTTKTVVYSLGIILLEMIAKIKVFDEESLEKRATLNAKSRIHFKLSSIEALPDKRKIIS